MTLITPAEIDSLVQTWNERVDALGYKAGTKTCAKLEAEFFVGAISGLAAVGRDVPPAWALIIMSGRSLSATLAAAKPCTA